MNKEEKARDAIERMVANRKAFNDAMTGHDTTLDQARKDSERIIQKWNRDRGAE